MPISVEYHQTNNYINLIEFVSIHTFFSTTVTPQTIDGDAPSQYVKSTLIPLCQSQTKSIHLTYGDQTTCETSIPNHLLSLLRTSQYFSRGYVRESSTSDITSPLNIPDISHNECRLWNVMHILKHVQKMPKNHTENIKWPSSGENTRIQN